MSSTPKELRSESAIESTNRHTHTAGALDQSLVDISREGPQTVVLAAKKRKVAPSTSTVPRLVSVVEIIKREYLQAVIPGPCATGLHQYTQLGYLEENDLVDGPHEHTDENERMSEITTALEGRNQ